MPRIPRNPGSGKAPVNTPARATREDKAGAGWGGAAKGAGKTRFDALPPEQLAAIQDLARDPKHMEAKAAVREAVLMTVMDIMLNGDSDGARVTAALGMAKKVGLQDEPTETRHTGADGGAVVLKVVTGVPRASD